MEKAILKTLIYADIFDYPLKAYEIHKWLIGRPATLRQVEQALIKLLKKRKIQSVKDYYFLKNKKNLVFKRLKREKQSARFLFKAKFWVWFLQIIPTLKLVGISGGLAMDNADKKDDIDLFLITSKNRLWLSRILVVSILDFMGVRRKAKMKLIQVAGKLCANILLEEGKLEQENKDIFTAHEVLQMRVLWERDRIYRKYLEDNEWVFKFLPNWVGFTTSSSSRRRGFNKQKKVFNWIPASAGMTMEKLAKWIQLKIMVKPQGRERVEEGALYFHPNDIRPQILAVYRQKVKDI